MDGGAWLAAVHRVAKSRTRLSDFTFTFHFSLSYIGEGNGNPLQCSCLENPRDGGAWWAAIYGVAQSRTWLKLLSSSSSSKLHPLPLETLLSPVLLVFLSGTPITCMLASTLAWKIPWTEEPGRVQSMGLQRVRHHWGEGNGTPLQYSCLENPMDRRAW